MKNIVLVVILALWLSAILSIASAQQPFQFALVTDTHVGGATGADDLRRTVTDLNGLVDVDFVILSGDVTEFGSDEELLLAKQILDSLEKPLYIVPGNHDSNWSESGANSFRQVFGSETFSFQHKGYMFMGMASGPNMRMSPGQIPRENLVWMDSVFEANADKDIPLIYINHYPLDSSLNNWYEAIDRLKTRNVQLAMCGHGHQNRLYDWEGIPGVMNRSNLRAKDSIGGYNIITLDGEFATYAVRRPLWKTEDSWLKVPLKQHNFSKDTKAYKRPDFSVNQKFKDEVSVAWTFQDDSDLGLGLASYRNSLITGNTTGAVYALEAGNGQKLWEFQTGGKIYSTPAIWKDRVVVGSSDHTIYGLHARTGQLQWSIHTDKAVLGSPAIENGVAFIGGSDGKFRAIDVEKGTVLWVFNQLQGYVSAKPTLYKDKVIFGDWGNGFYALDKNNGHLLWTWDNGHKNRMFSAAACYPVAAHDRIFIVAPDRYMTCLDAHTGAVIWREKKDPIRVRESMGLSEDGKLVYVKTMDGELLGISTSSDTMEVVWKAELQLPYELSPSAIESAGNYVFVPSHSGLLSAVDSRSGEVLWQYKLSNGMINPILVLQDKEVVASTMDGVITKLNLR